MLEINSSNEYRVALEMYQESVELLNKLSSEMTDFFKDLGYNVLIIYNDNFKRISVRNLDDNSIDDDDISKFTKRFQLVFIEKSKTHTKNTTIGKYGILCYYHFKPKR